jgi:hypothetical protein
VTRTQATALQLLHQYGARGLARVNPRLARYAMQTLSHAQHAARAKAALRRPPLGTRGAGDYAKAAEQAAISAGLNSVVPGAGLLAAPITDVLNGIGGTVVDAIGNIVKGPMTEAEARAIAADPKQWIGNTPTYDADFAPRKAGVKGGGA